MLKNILEMNLIEKIINLIDSQENQIELFINSDIDDESRMYYMGKKVIIEKIKEIIKQDERR